MSEGRSMQVLLCALAILAMLMLSACGSTASGGVKSANYRTGTMGMDMVFIKNAPPTRVYEGQDFQAGLTVSNKGATDVSNAILTLSIEKDYMSFADGEGAGVKRIQVKGKSMFNLQGEKDTFFYELTTGLLENMSQYHYSDIFATLCYPYSTYLLDDVCIDTDPLNMRVGKKVCTAKTKSFSGQGAPVSITKIETEMLPKGDEVFPLFTIYLQNTGKGRVVRLADLDKVCTASSVPSDVYGGFTIQAMLGSDTLECSPKNFRLLQDADYLRCTLPSGKPGFNKQMLSFQRPLSIQLDYGYTLTQSTKMQIERFIR